MGQVLSRFRVVSVVSILVLSVAGFLAGQPFLSRAAQDPPQSDFSPFASPVALPGGDLPGNVSIQLVKVAGGLVDPVNLANAGDGSGRLFVVQRTGQILIID